MKYGSLFTGIGGFDIGFEQAGMKSVWQVEIDKACRSVLEKHWPEVRRYEDVRECGKNNLEPVDLICGGFPCQDLSVAGKRAGLAGERSGLWYEFHRIIEELRPGWVVIENVPGLLSSNRGRDFAVILRGLVECGYGVVWRVLDSQYFGVAQRRRRVFIVGHLGDGRAAEVLFEREGSGGDTPPRREKGQGVAHAISASPTATGRLDPNGQDFVTSGEKMFDAGGIHREHFSYEFTQTLNGYDTPLTGKAYTIQQNDGGDHSYSIRTANTQGLGFGLQEDVMGTLDDGKGSAVSHGVGVRRLIPTECERLQGFPDGWTAGRSDAVRYRQLGNAVTVSVIEWIGKRILLVDDKCQN